MFASISLTCFPYHSNAASAAISATSSDMTESAQANALITRLSEIKSMDKANLTAPEKKGLRKEVRSIQHQLRDIGNGIYISAGALILILILLIILL